MVRIRLEWVARNGSPRLAAEGGGPYEGDSILAPRIRLQRDLTALAENRGTPPTNGRRYGDAAAGGKRRERVRFLENRSDFA